MKQAKQRQKLVSVTLNDAGVAMLSEIQETLGGVPRATALHTFLLAMGTEYQQRYQEAYKGLKGSITPMKSSVDMCSPFEGGNEAAGDGYEGPDGYDEPIDF